MYFHESTVRTYTIQTIHVLRTRSITIIQYGTWVHGTVHQPATIQDYMTHNGRTLELLSIYADEDSVKLEHSNRIARIIEYLE